MFKIAVFKKTHIRDAEGNAYLSSIQDLKINTSKVNIHKLYMLDGDLSQKDAEIIAEKILIDPIIEDYEIDNSSIPSSESYPPQQTGNWKVYKTFHYGVTDNIGERTLKAIKDLKISNIKHLSVSTGEIFYVYENLTFAEIDTISNRIFVNPVIESYSIQKI